MPQNTSHCLINICLLSSGNKGSPTLGGTVKIHWTTDFFDIFVCIVARRHNTHK